jgi:hypothetical protein
MKTLLLFLFASSGLLGQTSISLNVTAAGTQPFTYKWTKDGVPLSSTSNPLVISPVTAAASGQYQATVLNAAGSATTPPSAIVVTASASQAVDLSKQYLEASLTAPYNPPVNQWEQGFAVVPIKKVSDPGAHFNDATGIYTVGPGEAGVYEVQISLRAADQPPPNVSVGVTAGTTNGDIKTGWGVTPPATGNYIHWGMNHTITRFYPDGAQIRCNAFVASALTIQGYDVIMRRLF